MECFVALFLSKAKLKIAYLIIVYSSISAIRRAIPSILLARSCVRGAAAVALSIAWRCIASCWGSSAVARGSSAITRVGIEAVSSVGTVRHIELVHLWKSDLCYIILKAVGVD